MRSFGKGTKSAREQARNNRTNQEKELMNGRVAEKIMEEGREVKKGSRPDWYGDKDIGATPNKGKGKFKSET